MLLQATDKYMHAILHSKLVLMERLLSQSCRGGLLLMTAQYDYALEVSDVTQYFKRQICIHLGTFIVAMEESPVFSEHELRAPVSSATLERVVSRCTKNKLESNKLRDFDVVYTPRPVPCCSNAACVACLITTSSRERLP